MGMIDQPGGSFSLATLSGTDVLVTQQKGVESPWSHIGTDTNTTLQGIGGWHLLPRAALPGDEGF